MAGGSKGIDDLSSTEILVTLAGVWRTVGPLPTAVGGLSGATLDNRVFMLGEGCTHGIMGTGIPNKFTYL